MKHTLARLLIALGAALLGLGRRLEKPAPPPAAKMTIDLPARWYKPARPGHRGLNLSWMIPAPLCVFG